MNPPYERPCAGSSGLRLHLNENTAGCSPTVIEALRALTPGMVAAYPDCSTAMAAVARHFNLPESHIALTNGLDEGLLAASLAAAPDGSAAEAIVVAPTFEMQPLCARLAGMRVVDVPLEADFTFPIEHVLRSVCGETRIVFITSPHNPTGLLVSHADILAIATVAPRSLVLVDEAYAEFSGTTLLGTAALQSCRNIVVGRTFSKAYGLAGLRCGALIGAPDVIERLRSVLLPYNVNVAAVTALTAALQDREYHEQYVAEVRQSRALLYEAFDRWRIEYWRSQANFVLARFGDNASWICRALAERGIHVRDRSGEPLCGGCVRVTAGVVEHTKQCIAILEEVLCAAQ